MADNKFNSEQALARCEPMSKLQAVIGGKWKILILWYVAHYKVQVGGNYPIHADQAAARAGSGRLSAPGDLPGNSAAGGIFPDGIWSKLCARAGGNAQLE